jgi:hypothetical protein
VKTGWIVMSAVVSAALVLATVGTSAPTPAAGTIFRVRPDLRMCPSPLCGGFWVRRANRATTTCVDGTARAWCYVTGIDHVRSRGGSFLVRGQIVRSSTAGLPGRLSATGEWAPATATPWGGAVYLVTDAGIRCVRAPCFSLRAAVVNTTLNSAVSGLDLAAVGAMPALVRKAEATLTAGGLLIAGTIRRDADGGRSVRATQFFLAAG